MNFSVQICNYKSLLCCREFEVVETETKSEWQKSLVCPLFVRELTSVSEENISTYFRIFCAKREIIANVLFGSIVSLLVCTV